MNVDKWVCQGPSQGAWAPSLGQTLDLLIGAWATRGKIRP